MDIYTDKKCSLCTHVGTCAVVNDIAICYACISKAKRLLSDYAVFGDKPKPTNAYN